MSQDNSPELSEYINKYVDYIKEKAKYGINPVTALDYSSLYPSLIMAYNLSPEYLITDVERKNDLIKRGFELHEIDFMYNFEDSYGNKRSKNIIAWTVRHDDTVNKTNKLNEENNRFGLYPKILKELFRQRFEMKKYLEIYQDKKEHMEKENGDKKDLETNTEYQDCLFQLQYCDTKQKALKVYMNCFYGELGNKNSPLFILELAGGITSAGQYNLRKVKKFIEDKKCKTYYGDTDSLYFTFSDESFIDIHKSYLLTNYEVKRYKEDYCTALVDRTFKMVKEMTILVNNFLRQDNGTEYLKMAYEEVLYPVVFLSRKKYYGIEHKKIVNFYPKKIFIRGLEVKKRGVSELLKIICMELMWETMNIFNYKTLRDLVMNKIDYLYAREWKMEEFIQTGLWKPNKKNQTLIRYVNRLISEGRDPPDAYERFNYVIVKITDPMRLYDFKGRKIDIKKGDKMEYIEYTKENNLEIDLDYYFEKQISGQFARLISYDDEFHVYSDKKCDSEWEEVESAMEIEDDKTMKVCRKFIKEYATKWNGGYSDLANVYKSVYRYADRLINDKKKSIISKDKQLGIMVDYREENKDINEDIDSVVDYRKIIIERVERIVTDIKFKQVVEQYSKDSVKDIEKTSINVTKMYCKNKNSYLTKMLNAINIDYEKNINEFIKFCKDNNIDSIIFNSNQNNLTPMIQNIRSKISEGIISIDSSEEDITSVMKDYMSLEENTNEINKEKLNSLLKQAYSIFINIVSIKRNEMIHNSIHDFNQKRIIKNDVPKRIKGFRL
jgi:hypothetical protein